MSANRELLLRVARRVEPLLDRLVFVGGAVAEFYFTDPASDRVRPTTDADAICEVESYTEHHRLGDRLRELGFRQSAREADPPYRWRCGDDVFDLMPKDPAVLGFSNPGIRPPSRGRSASNSSPAFKYGFRHRPSTWHPSSLPTEVGDETIH